MKKHIFSSDKYNCLIDKNKKKFKPNLKSTDELNSKVISDFGKLDEYVSVNDNDLINRFSHIINRKMVEHDRTKQLSVIVPYRNRAEHLEIFKENISIYLEKQGIDYHITVVEQANNEIPFNKGILLNVGFLETSVYDYFCFHDIDMLPFYADYGYDIHAHNKSGFFIHLAKWIEQYSYNEIENVCGGVVLVDRKTYRAINGYSIGYWGWGYEDNDFKRRCYANKNTNIINLDGIYTSLYHPHNFDINHYTSNSIFFNKTVDSQFDGLKQTKYEILSKTQIDDKTTFISILF